MAPGLPSFLLTGRVRQFVFQRNFDLKEAEYASAALVAQLYSNLLIGCEEILCGHRQVGSDRFICWKAENNPPCPMELILTKTYSLDTSTCIDVIRNTNPKARQQFEQAVVDVMKSSFRP